MEQSIRDLEDLGKHLANIGRAGDSKKLVEADPPWLGRESRRRAGALPGDSSERRCAEVHRQR